MTDEKRAYRKQRRAELEEATRRRITESAVVLHGTLGPSRTSLSAIASHAGVRRSTLYRHFADEAAVFEACTAHWTAANPVPDLGRWAAIANPDERVRVALGELYPYYRHTEQMLTNLFRDEHHAPRRPTLCRIPGLPRGHPRPPDERPRATRSHSPPSHRGDRPRTCIHDVEITRQRTRTRRPHRRRPHVPPDRRLHPPTTICAHAGPDDDREALNGRILTFTLRYLK